MSQVRIGESTIPRKCWVSQRCESQTNKQTPEAEKFTIVQREGLGKDLCKAISLLEKCPKSSWPGLYVSLFYRQGETPRQNRFPERSGNYLAQWEKLQR